MNNSFESWLTIATSNKPSDLRYGQWLFNTLTEIRPDLTAQVRATENDPFYNDDRVPAFLAWVARHWDTGDIGTLVDPVLWRVARMFCADTDNTEYVRGQAELIIDMTPHLTQDDKAAVISALTAPLTKKEKR